MKEYFQAAREIALDTIADNLVDALTTASVGGTTASAHHIGQAASDILELSNIVHEESKP